jgi:hypothetical protein
MLNFDPFDPRDELQLFNLIPDGEYDFIVKDSSDHVSKSTGNQSIKLTCAVFDANGMQRIIDCYLSVNYKKLLAHFCSATGLEEECKKGTLNAAMCLERSGKCAIGTDMPEAGSKYDPKNVITDFCKRTVVPAPVKDDGFGDSDIPF